MNPRIDQRSQPVEGADSIAYTHCACFGSCNQRIMVGILKIAIQVKLFGGDIIYLCIRVWLVPAVSCAALIFVGAS